MASPFISDSYYPLTEDLSPATADLIFGAIGQSPNYTVYLNMFPIPGYTHVAESKTNIPLGDNTSLKGKILTIVGNIVDMPISDNLLTLDVTINGGKNKLQKSFSVSTITGDAVAVSITIRFI